MTLAEKRGEMFVDDFKHQLPDLDEQETTDWIRSLDDVVDQEGEPRARFLLYKLLKRARQLQVGLPPLTNTRYINTISPEQEPEFPGDEVLERRIRRLIRWNAVAMVLRANTRFPGIGGHLSTYASAATRSTSRATPRQASTPAPTWRDAFRRTGSTASARSSRTADRARAFPRTRIRGSCRTSGSSPRSRWASAR